MVDIGAIAEHRADAHVALHQRRQLEHGVADIIAAERQALHRDALAGQHHGALVGRGKVMVIQIRQRRGKYVRVDSGEARAAEHHRDLLGRDIFADAAPEQRDRARCAIGCQNAGPAQFEHFARVIDTAAGKRGQIEFARRIETPRALRYAFAQKTIGAHHGILRWCILVDDQKMVAQRIERIDIETHRRRGDLGTHFLLEYAPAQTLHGGQIGRILSEADREAAFDGRVMHSAGHGYSSPSR